MSRRSPRLQFTEQELASPQVERAAEKAEKKILKLEEAEDKSPKERQKAIADRFREGKSTVYTENGVNNPGVNIDDNDGRETVPSPYGKQRASTHSSSAFVSEDRPSSEGYRRAQESSNPAKLRFRRSEEEQIEQAADDVPGSGSTAPASVKEANKKKAYSKLRMDYDREPIHTDKEKPDAEPGTSRKAKQKEINAANFRKAEEKAAKSQSQNDPESKTKLSFEEKKPPSKLAHTARKQLDVAEFAVHRRVAAYEDDNVGLESAHKAEETSEAGARLAVSSYRASKLKPYHGAVRAEREADKASLNAIYKLSREENPDVGSNPFSKWKQRQAIKQQYTAIKAGKAVSGAGTAAGSTVKASSITSNAAKAVQKGGRIARSFVTKNKKLLVTIGAIGLVIAMATSVLQSCSYMFTGGLNSIVGTTYTSEDRDLIAVEKAYCAMENELQAEVDSIESTYPGYDDYRCDLDNICHDPHELASLLTAVFQSYTLSDTREYLEEIFSRQYTLTVEETVETDEDGAEHRILSVTLTNHGIGSVANELLTPEQKELYDVYFSSKGNKPLVFGGGSMDTGGSESLSGVHFVNGTRPGNTEVVELAKRQAGNVGGQPYWSWYGFNSRVEWCACFVSWCYGQMGLSEPRFAACQSQGVAWFQSHGQWGARGYANIAPGDAIFFDWDGDGSADHVGLVIGTDGSRVYTVEGNSGDACKIKSYDINYGCIKGYGLMNW